MSASPLVETVNLEKHFPLTRTATEVFTGRSRRVIHAVDGVSLTVMPGETVGLIGESGSGKTTLGWVIARLHDPTSGLLRFEGQDLMKLDEDRLRRWRQNVQVVFQDPVGSLDPRLRVWQIVGEPLRAQNQAERWFARNEPKRILAEHQLAVRKERVRLWLECRPAEKERRRLLAERTTMVEEWKRKFEEESIRIERRYHAAVDTLRKPPIASDGGQRPAPAPEAIAVELQRLTTQYQKGLAARKREHATERVRMEKYYRDALKRARGLTISPEQKKQREAAYRAFLKKGLPPPVIPKIPVPKVLRKAKVREKVAAILPVVGLPDYTVDQYPHEFSGGGRQRVSLARALVVDPKLIVLDEPTSALDVAVQAQILNRLVELQRERGFAYLLITHNVAAVRYVADRVAVMYLGRVVEVGSVHGVLEKPVHPYTKALLAALPVADVRRRRTRFKIGGDVPSLVDPPPGCRFASRCPFVVDHCRAEYPALREMPGDPGHLVSCHRAEEVADIAPASLLTTEPGPAPVPPAPA
jgi:oligopeptide/dipeptide ABC transporter ATP-binding protein